ncbi:glutamate receptor ionotropic, kainate 2-like isoform X2 [Argiope bruennichi]|uniref:Glutamate receptor ionotropic like protein n=1 Tax=Argiope bruennichi TaxID=94029 RepID=A0A8T0F0U5_ARGBR|nr:glutamate receptor ionotropic, kainate 2-like isoform X2 [Argiope bruennichi]KAF8784441.1 Glutamate receptor ionotropic like protein [Argiope bruennichi]
MPAPLSQFVLKGFCSVSVFLVVLLHLPENLGLPSDIHIGGLFDTEDDEQELAFRIAVDKINADTSVLPRSRLVAQVEKVGIDDSFRATKKVCSLLETGIAGIFGPQSDVTSMHVQSICDAIDIPHVETRWDFQLQRADMSINLFPRPSVLSQAYVDLVKIWGWRSFSLVYDEHEGVIRLQDFLKEAQINDWRVQLYQFRPSHAYRDIFWRIKSAGESRIVLDVKRDSLRTVLKHAQQVGMMTESHNYLITSLDLHTIDMEDFKYGKTNITGFRLVDENNADLQALVVELNTKWSGSSKKLDLPIKTIRTETALMYDAVQLFAKALQDLDGSKAINFPPISCDSGLRGLDGSSIINFMKPSSIQGLTGKVKFDEQGFRSEFVLDLIYLTKDGLEKIGAWAPGKGINITKNMSNEYDTLLLQNKTLIVTTYVNSPYAMLKDSAAKLTGNARYEGFCIDLIDHLAKLLGFKYIIKEVADRAYGIKNETGHWNGMIGELINGVADIAIVDLTITSSREEAVDFTMPFMNTGISILFKKPTTKVTTLFSFLSPFSMEVWIYVMGAHIGVSITLFLVGRLSPYEWDNPHPCRQDEQVLENSFSLMNSLWFTIGSLMQQGSDLAPRAMSTRTIAGIWYFFTLIMISSYTANLAAFLTVEKVIYPVENAEDLAKQTKIKYGCLGSGSTKAFFKESKIPTYQKMWNFMNSNPNVFMPNNEKGVERVMQGDYAYLMESASIEYITERNCNLTQIGGLLDSKGYGIATRKGSKYRTPLSSGILKLQEDGILHILKERWWKQKKGGGKCMDDSKKSSSGVTELGLGNVGGVFVVLLTGLALAAFVAVIEFFWKARKLAHVDREPLCKEMFRELKFALSCRSSTKPVIGRKQDNCGEFRVSTIPGYSTQY